MSSSAIISTITLLSVTLPIQYDCDQLECPQLAVEELLPAPVFFSFPLLDSAFSVSSLK